MSDLSFIKDYHKAGHEPELIVYYDSLNRQDKTKSEWLTARRYFR